MSSRIDISFIVPVYSSEPFLVRCLDSILKQKSIFFELIVINDASPGNCDEIIDSYLSKFKNIKYIKHDFNKGLMQARLTGLGIASGEYIAHVDSDDWISKDTGVLAFNTAKKYSADVIQFGMYYGDSQETMVEHFSNRDYYLKGREIIDKFLDGELWWTQAGKLFRRETVLEALRTYPVDRKVHVNSLEDLALTFPVILKSSVYVSVKKAGCYYYYCNPNSMTKGRVSSEVKWTKLCQDMGFVRHTVLDHAALAGIQEIDRLEGLFQKNYDWASKMLKKVSQHQRVYFLKILNQSFSMRHIVQNMSVAHFCDFAKTFENSAAAAQKSKTIKKIAFICEVFHSGGAERATALLAKIFVENGYDVTVVTDAPEVAEEYWSDRRLKRVAIGANRGIRWGSLRRFVQEREIDVCIHISHYREQMMFDLLALKDICWNVAVEHSMFFFPFYKPNIELFGARRAAYNNSDALVCLSEVNKRWWVNAGAKNVYVIPNPLTFLPSQDRISSGKTKNIIFVGRLCEMKGAHEALELFKLIQKKHPTSRMIMLGRYGSADDKALIEEFISTNGMGDKIIIKGHVNDVGTYFEESRVHIMTSLVEGAPMVLNEAKSHAVPSVLLGLSYLENTNPEQGAVRVPKGDIGLMAEVVSDLLSDDLKWGALSRAALNSLDLNLDKIILSRWVEIFDRLLSSSPVEEGATETTMSEFLDGMDYFIRQRISEDEVAYTPPYLLRISSIVNKYLPEGSPRRRIASAAARLVFRFLLGFKKNAQRVLLRLDRF